MKNLKDVPEVDGKLLFDVLPTQPTSRIKKINITDLPVNELTTDISDIKLECNDYINKRNKDLPAHHDASSMFVIEFLMKKIVQLEKEIKNSKPTDK